MDFFDSLKFEYTFDYSHVGIGITTSHSVVHLLKFYGEYMVATFGKNLQAFL